MKRHQAFVSTDWLARHLGDPALKALDASWHLPGSGRDALSEFKERHIPGATFFDLDGISDPASPYPHMLPGELEFTRMMRKLGLGNHDRIVIYDSGGVQAAVRAFWMFRIFGHDDVRILDGGFGKWLSEGQPVEAGAPEEKTGHFSAQRRQDMLATKADVAHAIREGSGEILDARGGPRFSGREAEPRPGLRGGHMPGAKNIPYGNFYKADGTFIDEAGLQALFEEAGVDLTKPLITTCGSGVTACILELGLKLIGKSDVRVYDGSWVEWASDPETPVVTE